MNVDNGSLPPPRTRRPKQPAARLLLYSHDSYGLGHFRRNLAIADAVAADMPFVSTLCLTGSPRAHSFPLPPRFDYVKIPSVTKGAEGQYRARSLSLGIAETTRLRESIILETVRGYHPHVVLVDHTPLGMRGELRATLRALRRESPATRVVLGLRDILDDEETVLADWAREGVLPMIEECYDRIWVYGTPDVFDPRVRYRFPRAIAERVRFLGYVYRNGVVADPTPLRAEAASRTGKLVVVTVGGGGDGHRIIRKYLSALAGYPNGTAPFDSVIVTGPLMSERKCLALEAAAKERSLPARFVKFAPNLLDWFAAADAVVCMAGYNTMCEVAALGRPAIVIPREFPRREQAIRARRFEELGHCKTIPLAELSGKSIRHALETILDRRSANSDALPPVPLDFGGLKRIAPEMRDLLGLPPEPVSAEGNGTYATAAPSGADRAEG
jgi:predicted glycosyltransferase